MIVDAHQHFWDPARGDYRWLTPDLPIHRIYGADDLRPLLQAAGVTLVMTQVILSFANLLVMGLVLRAWGREGVQDVGRFIFKLLFRMEVKGLENLPKEGERVVIAPNHISLLDGPIMHAILPGHAAFAVDTGMWRTSNTLSLWDIGRAPRIAASTPA